LYRLLVQPSRPRTETANEFNQDSGHDESGQDWLDHVEEVLAAGSRIEHRTMGLGTVLKRSGDIVEVRFDGGALKKLALGIAPIKLVASE
jgi:hypothetical protein